MSNVKDIYGEYRDRGWKRRGMTFLNGVLVCIWEKPDGSKMAENIGRGNWVSTGTMMKPVKRDIKIQFS